MAELEVKLQRHEEAIALQYQTMEKILQKYKLSEQRVNSMEAQNRSLKEEYQTLKMNQTIKIETVESVSMESDEKDEPKKEAMLLVKADPIEERKSITLPSPRPEATEEPEEAKEGESPACFTTPPLPELEVVSRNASSM